MAVKDPSQLAADYGVPVPTIQGGNSQDPAIYWGPWVHPIGSEYNMERPTKYQGALYEAQVPEAASRRAGESLGLTEGGVSQDYYSQVPEAAQENYGPSPNADGSPGGVNSTSTVNGSLQYLAQLQTTDQEKFWDIGDEMVRLGWLKPGYNSSEVYDIWQKAAQKAAFVFNGGQGAPLTINQVLHMDSPALGGSGFSDLAGTQQGAGRLTTHQTTTQTDISSLSEIKGAARNLSASALGRDLSPEELARVAAYVQGAQANHPTIQSRTDVPVGETGTQSTVRTTGGLDAATTIEDRLRENPDYAEHQAAALYAPALFSALGATV